jgi:bifunctional non-homologous end joining protein LigD
VIDLSDTPKGTMPRHVKPMLATLVDKPFDRRGWAFEVKWDGYRAVAEVPKRGAVSLYSRNQQSYIERFAPLCRSLRRLRRQVVLDGEIVVLDDRGRSQFQLLQNYQRTGQGVLRYCVFDLLYLDGHDLRGQPFRRRKEWLAEILTVGPEVFLSEHVGDEGSRSSPPWKRRGSRVSSPRTARASTVRAFAVENG